MLGLAAILVVVACEGASQGHHAAAVLLLLVGLLGAPVEVAAAVLVGFRLIGEGVLLRGRSALWEMREGAVQAGVVLVRVTVGLGGQKLLEVAVGLVGRLLPEQVRELGGWRGQEGEDVGLEELGV